MGDAKKKNRLKKSARPVASLILGANARLEIIYDTTQHRTAFALSRDGIIRTVAEYTTPEGERVRPYSADNNLLKHRVVMLPSAPAAYDDESGLLDDIRRYIHRYVDVSPAYERIAAYYVLFTWVYDRFNEVPYLRVRGDYGSGKTRFLQTVGSICYLPMFASGASTISPLFHTIDAFRGTLVIDEADFRFSDEKSEIVKILNNGNIKGMPVLRTLADSKNEYNPRAFAVFGPKIIASRGNYQDRALESRFITEDMGSRRLRSDVPFNLPPEQETEANELRNMLLMYRLKTPTTPCGLLEPVDPSVEPRLNQIFSPLLSMMTDPACRSDLRKLALQYHADIMADRGMTVEAEVLQVIVYLAARAKGPNISLSDIAETFRRHFGGNYREQVTNRWVGSILRKKLHLTPHKSEGVFVLSLSERHILEAQLERYGISDATILEDNGTDELKLVFEPDEHRG